MKEIVDFRIRAAVSAIRQNLDAAVEQVDSIIEAVAEGVERDEIIERLEELRATLVGEERMAAE